MDLTVDPQEALDKVMAALRKFEESIKQVFIEFSKAVSKCLNTHRDKLKAKAKYERRVRNRHILHNRNKNNKRRR